MSGSFCGGVVMTLAPLPEKVIPLNARRIAKLEICSRNPTRVEARIFLMGDQTPCSFVFQNKADAVDFYRRTWQLRSRETSDEEERFLSRAVG